MRSCCQILNRKWIENKLYFICHHCGWRINYGEVIFNETLKTIDKMGIKKRTRTRDAEKQSGEAFKIMAKIKGCGDSNMIFLWRKAVLKKNGHRCFLCGKDYGLDCHHIVKSRNKILRYDYRNGVPVCNFGCHQKLDSIAGRKMLEEFRPFDIIHVTEFEKMTFKDYLLSKGMTEREFLEEKKKELNRIIGE